MGFEIDILSAEKAAHYDLNGAYVSELVRAHHIRWHTIRYTKRPRVFSTWLDIKKMQQKAFSLHKKKAYDLLHCRSYIASLIGMKMKKRFKVPFVFDMRGFWADERVEGGIWNTKNPLYKGLYDYFKKQETLFITHAAHIVSLTRKGKEIILSRFKELPPEHISVIPCCTDTDFFSASNVSASIVKDIKTQLKIGEADKVLGYLGSIGTWYMAEEMMAFFSELITHDKHFKFLFITYEDKATFYKWADSYDIPHEKIAVYKAVREQLPSVLSLLDAAVFFIRPVFSKKASSPTKQGELLSMGIPIICNAGIGDSDTFITEEGCGALIDDFTQESYKKTAGRIENILNLPKNRLTDTAVKYFSLTKGVEKYADIYKKIKP